MNQIIFGMPARRAFITPDILAHAALPPIDENKLSPKHELTQSQIDKKDPKTAEIREATRQMIEDAKSNPNETQEDIEKKVQLIIEEERVALKKVEDPAKRKKIEIYLNTAEKLESLSYYQEALENYGKALNLAVGLNDEAMQNKISVDWNRLKKMLFEKKHPKKRMYSGQENIDEKLKSILEEEKADLEKVEDPTNKKKIEVYLNTAAKLESLFYYSQALEKYNQAYDVALELSDDSRYRISYDFKRVQQIIFEDEDPRDIMFSESVDFTNKNQIRIEFPGRSDMTSVLSVSPESEFERFSIDEKDGDFLIFNTKNLKRGETYTIEVKSFFGDYYRCKIKVNEKGPLLDKNNIRWEKLKDRIYPRTAIFLEKGQVSIPSPSGTDFYSIEEVVPKDARSLFHTTSYHGEGMVFDLDKAKDGIYTFVAEERDYNIITVTFQVKDGEIVLEPTGLYWTMEESEENYSSRAGRSSFPSRSYHYYDEYRDDSSDDIESSNELVQTEEKPTAKETGKVKEPEPSTIQKILRWLKKPVRIYWWDKPSSKEGDNP